MHSRPACRPKQSEDAMSPGSQGGGSPLGFPGSDPGGDGGDGSGNFGLGHVPRNARSIGAGSGAIHDESIIYKAKDLQLVVVQTLPTDAAQFRGWRNSFLTKASAKDRTGQNSIRTWLLEAFSANTTVEQLEITSLQMPR